MKRIASLLTTLCLLQSAHGQTITSAVPGFISYQGRALDAAGVVIGSGTPVNRTVIFRVWNDSSNILLANLLYSEQQTVTISNGEFSVLIGQGVATAGSTFGYVETTKGPGGSPAVKIGDLGVFGGSARYLGVTIDDGVSGNVDNEITPRQQIVSSAYAFRAKYAEQLGSNGTAALTALDSGNVGIGNTAPPALFTISGANTSTTTSTPQLLVTADDITERLRIGVDSTNNGTGFIQSYKEGSGAQNLLLNPSGGNVGIGSTTAPTVALSVTGAITATGAITGGSFATAGNITTSSGSVGIGTTAPNAKLTVGAPIGDTATTTSVSFSTNAGTIGTAAGSELLLGNFGFSDGDYDSFSISGYRTAAGTTWADTALVLGRNVDSTKRASGSYLSLHSSGNVGIGTLTPLYKLDVAGSARVTSLLVDAPIASRTTTGTVTTAGAIAHIGAADSLTYFGSYDGTNNYGNWIQSMRSWDTATFPLVLNPNGGNVGIGTASPIQKLDVNGNAYVRGQLNLDGAIVMGNGPAIWGTNSAGVAEQAFFPRSSNGTYIRFGTNGFYLQNNAGTNLMYMLNNGNVAIGSPAYNDARLNVGWSYAGFNFDGYVDGNGGQSGAATVANWVTSIKAEGDIVGGGIRVFSDLRIKADLHPTDSLKDLKTLMGIEVTNYHFKDTLANGNAPQKKVIAQQVETVYPQAINASKGVVPDIFKKATFKDGWIELATDLKVGDRVRLISGKEEGIHEVLEVKANRFLTKFKTAGDLVFVYGREVEDFRSVDYDALSMLNISATQQIKREKDAENQELARQLKSVQDENTALRRELAAKEQSVEARLIALEQRLAKVAAAKPVSIKTAN